MATLKNTDRTDVLCGVLTEAFKPRFAALQKSAEEMLRKVLAKDHPRFVELLADPSARAYLATSSSKVAFRADESPNKRVRLAAPVYGVAGDEPNGAYRELEGKTVLTTEAICPCYMGDFVIDDAKFLKTYSQVWSDYSAAHSKLSSVLNSYKTREKLVEDFPEFEAHLPALVSPAKLPAVIVKDVRLDLKKLGVPSGVSA